MRSLPSFKYHPDPLATEVIVPSAKTCVCCNQANGYIYVVSVYAEEEYDEQFCPWCIANGAANLKFDVTFTDDMGIGGYGEWDRVPDDVVSEVTFRTPGFSGWKQERWWTHCGDAAAFLGYAGRAELEAAGKEAIEVFRLDSDFSGDAWAALFSELDKNRSPTAYLFRCLHCRALGGYIDYI